MEIRITYLFKKQRAVEALFPIPDLQSTIGSPAQLAEFAIDKLHIRNSFQDSSSCKYACLESVHACLVMSGDEYLEHTNQIPQWYFDQNGFVNLEQLLMTEYGQ